MNSRPVNVSNHKSPCTGADGGNCATVMNGVRVTSNGVAVRAAGGGVGSEMIGPIVGPVGSTSTHVPTPDGPMYQSKVRPVIVLNHRSPSAGATGAMGELVTVGNPDLLS